MRSASMKQTIGTTTYDTESAKSVAVLIHEFSNRRSTSTVTTTLYSWRGRYFLHHSGSRYLARKLGGRGYEGIEDFDPERFGDLYHCHHNDWAVHDMSLWTVLEGIMQDMGPRPPGSRRAIDVGE